MRSVAASGESVLCADLVVRRAEEIASAFWIGLPVRSTGYGHRGPQARLSRCYPTIEEALAAPENLRLATNPVTKDWNWPAES